MPHTILTYCTYFGTMMMIDHDKFLPTLVMMSHTLHHENICRQNDGPHYIKNAQHCAWYKSTKRTTLPLPGKSQRTYLSTVNVHNARPIDSVLLAQPMSHDRTILVLPLFTYVMIVRLAVLGIVSYIGRQYARTVPNVDIIGSSKCHTRHLATGDVARLNYVLGTNSNPVMTCASDNQVNPYPNIVSVGPPLLVPGLYQQYQVYGLVERTLLCTIPVQYVERCTLNLRS